MIKLNQLCEPYPYSQTGRVYLKASTKKFYEYMKTKMNKPPDWLVTEWEPGTFVKVNVQLMFKNKQHGDPTNYLTALINGIVHALKRFKDSFDDKWILVDMKIPIFGKTEGIIFDIGIADANL